MDRPVLNPDAIARALDACAGPASSDYELDPGARAALAPGRVLRPASVLIPLVERGAHLHAVLTRRAVNLKRHPGQIAFPGGRQDPGDEGPLAAALREAEEEIGLAAASVEILGRLGTHETVTGFRVSPFVGRVAGRFDPAPDDAEVAEVFEVPLAFLLDPANLQLHRRRWNGVWRQYYAIPYGPYYVWGATARIAKTLADRVAAS